MNSKNPLVEFYQNVLAFANLHGDDKGYVRSNGGEKPIITVQTRWLVLPTRDQLRALTPDKEVFHPLGESSFTRISDALTTYIYRLNGALNTRFAETVWELHKFCTSPKKQVNMTPAQLKIIRNVTADEETKPDDSFSRFLAQQIAKNPSSAFVNITLGRGAMFRGQKKSRVGFVSFPLYRSIKEDLEKPRKESEFEGVSKKTLELVLQLYEAIFPGLDIPEEYGFGYETGLAPWFTTLMHTAGGLADSLNQVIEAFRDDFAADDFEPMNMKWLAVLQNQTEISRLSRMAQNTEIDPIMEGAPVPTHRQATHVTPAVAATPEVAVPAAAKVPFFGGATGAAPYVAPTQQTGYGRPEAQQKGRARVPFDQWKSQHGTPSALGATGVVMEAIRRYNEGYAQFYANHIQQWNMPPAGMPNPQSIPPNQPAPPYPGCPQLPLIPGLTAPMAAPGFGQQPQQQWAQPGMQMQPQQFGMQPQQMPPPGTWVQTPQGAVMVPYPQQQGQFNMQPQQAQAGWGQVWGQPAQPQQQQQWGQPQMAFNNQANSTHTGVVFPGAI